MKAGFRVAILIIPLSLSCCTMSPDEQFVREKIPIEIQSNKPVIIQVHSLSGSGSNEVGIRCSPYVWRALANDKNDIAVHLTSSNKQGTEIINVSPGDHNLYRLEAFYYLFSIGGEYRASASVEITFKTAPPGTTHAEILVLKTPADTGS